MIPITHSTVSNFNRSKIQHEYRSYTEIVFIYCNFSRWLFFCTNNTRCANFLHNLANRSKKSIVCVLYSETDDLNSCYDFRVLFFSRKLNAIWKTCATYNINFSVTSLYCQNDYTDEIENLYSLLYGFDQRMIERL